MHVCSHVYVWVISYVSRSPLALSLFKHLQIHADRLLNGVFGDERDKVFDVSLPVGRQLVDSWLPHHGLGDLSGVGWEVKRWTEPKHHILTFNFKLTLKILFLLRYQYIFSVCIDSNNQPRTPNQPRQIEDLVPKTGATSARWIWFEYEKREKWWQCFPQNGHVVVDLRMRIKTQLFQNRFKSLPTYCCFQHPP